MRSSSSPRRSGSTATTSSRAGGQAAFAALSAEAAAAETAGLSLHSSRGDLYLALLRGIAYATRANLEAMRALGASIRRVVAVGGGTADPLLLQLVSDACDTEQQVPGATIDASRSDALLAGLASGLVGRDAVAAWMSVDRVIRPRPGRRADHDRRYRAFGELYRATRSIVHELGAT